MSPEYATPAGSTPFVAVTFTRMNEPTSACCTVYGVVVAPMAAQVATSVVEQRCHS